MLYSNDPNHGFPLASPKVQEEYMSMQSVHTQTHTQIQK